MILLRYPLKMSFFDAFLRNVFTEKNYSRGILLKKAILYTCFSEAILNKKVLLKLPSGNAFFGSFIQKRILKKKFFQSS